MMPCANGMLTSRRLIWAVVSLSLASFGTGLAADASEGSHWPAHLSAWLTSPSSGPAGRQLESAAVRASPLQPLSAAASRASSQPGLERVHDSDLRPRRRHVMTQSAADAAVERRWARVPTTVLHHSDLDREQADAEAVSVEPTASTAPSSPSHSASSSSSSSPSSTVSSSSASASSLPPASRSTSSGYSLLSGGASRPEPLIVYRGFSTPLLYAHLPIQERVRKGALCRVEVEENQPLKSTVGHLEPKVDLPVFVCLCVTLATWDQMFPFLESWIKVKR
ncbi:unnamed protein product [Protopolystoma xenopodis]|uniref:Uncharacterized protein n=1 Tax=Protopolystoma xenopodis TaxID=117903 RepID=A0A448X5N2_9PLAT|nr:unnamed protein product [Protopolystoma xenopodis]